jgi:hypothetical protein
MDCPSFNNRKWRGYQQGPLDFFVRYRSSFKDSQCFSMQASNPQEQWHPMECMKANHERQKGGSEHLFKILPCGVVSKKTIGARQTL